MKPRILIIKHGSLGDLLIAEGAIRDICEHHHGDDITVLTGPAYRRIFQRYPYVQHVLVDPRSPRWRIDRLFWLWREVQFSSYDIIYDLQKSSRTAFYRRLFAPRSAWSGSAPGSTIPFELPPQPHTLQEGYRAQLQAADVPVRFTLQPDLSWMIDDVSTILRDAGVDGPYVVLLPGASTRHAHKCWPHYAELANALLDKGLRVVTVPGPDDLAVCRGMPGTMLTGPGPFLDFFGLAGVLAGAAFVVGNDSGPTHMAALLGTPGVAFFGGSGRKYMRNMQRRNFSCLYSDNIADITVDEVLAAEVQKGSVTNDNHLQ